MDTLIAEVGDGQVNDFRKWFDAIDLQFARGLEMRHYFPKDRDSWYSNSRVNLLAPFHAEKNDNSFGVTGKIYTDGFIVIGSVTVINLDGEKKVRIRFNQPFAKGVWDQDTDSMTTPITSFFQDSSIVHTDTHSVVRICLSECDDTIGMGNAIVRCKSM